MYKYDEMIFYAFFVRLHNAVFKPVIKFGAPYYIASILRDIHWLLSLSEVSYK